jgi:hypothetical protein
MNEIAAIAGRVPLLPVAGAAAAGGAAEPASLAREFDAMLLRMLWRTAAVPGAGKSAQSPLAATLADVYLPQLATQHSTGFGAMVLGALDPTHHDPRAGAAAPARAVVQPRSN